MSLTLDEFWDAKMALVRLSKSTHQVRAAGAVAESLLTLPCPKCHAPSRPALPGPRKQLDYLDPGTCVEGWYCPTHGPWSLKSNGTQFTLSALDVLDWDWLRLWWTENLPELLDEPTTDLTIMFGELPE